MGAFAKSLSSSVCIFQTGNVCFILSRLDISLLGIQNQQQVEMVCFLSRNVQFPGDLASASWHLIQVVLQEKEMVSYRLLFISTSSINHFSSMSCIQGKQQENRKGRWAQSGMILGVQLAGVITRSNVFKNDKTLSSTQETSGVFEENLKSLRKNTRQIMKT